MTPSAHARRFEPAPLAVAIGIVVQLLAVRLAFWSDGEEVRLFGAPFGSACSFRMHFGVPCPGCGLTRSVALLLHSHVTQAWALHPIGPIAIVGLMLLAVALFRLAVTPSGSAVRFGSITPSQVRFASVAYAGASVTFWIVWWLYRIQELQ